MPDDSRSRIAADLLPSASPSSSLLRLLPSSSRHFSTFNLTLHSFLDTRDTPFLACPRSTVPNLSSPPVLASLPNRFVTSSSQTFLLVFVTHLMLNRTINLSLVNRELVLPTDLRRRNCSHARHQLSYHPVYRHSYYRKIFPSGAYG